MNNDGLRILSTDIQYDSWEQLLFFRRDHNIIPMANWPVGLAEELQSISYPSQLPLQKDALSSLMEWLSGNADVMSALNQKLSQIQGLVNSVSTNSATYANASPMIDEFFQNAAGADYAKQLADAFDAHLE